jgi:hypothetical protein
MKLLIALAAALAVQAAGPRLVYSKSFPGSVPAYVGITVEKDGNVEYKEAPDDENPLKFKLSDGDTVEIFALAEKLDRFKRQLESGLKVANMGIKTFRFEDGAQKNEVKFNFTQDVDARALADWFERITETELHLVTLERTVRFDRLGTYKALLHLEASWDRKRIVAPQQFLPLLDRVSKNQVYVNLARERAAHLASVFRGEKSTDAGSSNP